MGIDFYDESNDLLKNDQDNDLNDKKLKNIDSITVNRDPSSDNDVSNKKHVDNELDKNTIRRFNQTLQKYIKVSVGNYTYNLTKYDKIQSIDVLEIRWPIVAQDMLSRWISKSLNKVGGSKLRNFLESAKTSSPTSHSGATSIPPIGNSSM